MKALMSFARSNFFTSSSITIAKRAGPYTPRWIFFWFGRCSPQTYRIRVVIRYLEVRYLVYYQFTSTSDCVSCSTSSSHFTPCSSSSLS
jgi:hypothetical protein